ncbi:MAG: ATP-binding protein [Saprospiraceae bacterium]|jgi:hypothetical protein|nr:ATP-binding protein [Saprospiraceae bacterium]
MIKNKYGPPVEGDDFFGRERETEYVWQRLMDGNNVMFPAPRRVGKSSFAKKLLAVAKADGWDTLEINLEKVHTEEAFMALFLEKLKDLSFWGRVKDKVSNLLDEVKSLKPKLKYEGVEVELEWQQKRADIYKAISDLLDHDKPTLIFFDELTVLLNSIVSVNSRKNEAENFLHWLRGIRQTSGSKIRWIFCSSIGISNFTFSHQITDAINDVPEYKLLAFDAETSLRLIKALEESANIELNDEIRQAMLDKIGYLLPFFIQILFERINSSIKVEQAKVDENLVANAYQDLLDDAHLNTWIERLQKQYGDKIDDAFVLLRHICQEKKGTKRDNLLNLMQSRHNDAEKAEQRLSALLHMLRNDGYLMDEGGLHFFRSPLIRDFWFKRHVL